MASYFISAIDTGVGKTIVTGLLTRYFKNKHNQSVVTYKPVQTGSVGIAEDILLHREIAAMPILEQDKKRITCPYVFPYAASPHLAAQKAQIEIQPTKLSKNLTILKDEFDIVLVEGAGGLMVPLNQQVLMIDWLAEQELPLILVTTARLGSINHTLLSIEVLKSRGLKVAGIVYSHYPQEDTQITKDSLKIIRRRCEGIPVIELPFISDILNPPEIDFSLFFKNQL